MLRVAIVEDQKKCSKLMLAYLRRYQTENAGENFVVDVYDNALDFLTDFEIDTDIVFMDIEMPMMNGFEAAQKLRAAGHSVCLIFVTNMAQYAVKGYEVDAMDFMVKPVSYFNFASKLEKASRIAKLRKKKDILVMTENGLRKIFVSDIYYLEVIKHNTFVHSSVGIFKQQVSLTEMEEKLKDFTFVRCNNCYLVNLEHVSSVDKNTVVVGGDLLQVSRPKKKIFLDALTRFLNGGIVV